MIFSIAGWLAALPTITTTGCGPEGAFIGISKFTSITPTSPAGIAWKMICAGKPATVTETGSVGEGRLFNGVLADGPAPVATAGETCPWPVMYRLMICPGLPLDTGVM